MGSDRRVCAVRADKQGLCSFGGVLRYLTDEPGQNAAWRPSAVTVPPLTSMSGEEGWLWGTDSTGNVFTWAIREGREGGKPVTITVLRRAVGIAKAASVAASTSYACVVGTNGRVQCWKPKREDIDSTTKREGTIRVKPDSIAGVDKAVHVAVDGQRACALLEDGTLVCWSGDAPSNPKSKASRKVSVVPLEGVSDAAQIVGPGFERGIGCAVLRSGQLTCWGPEGPAAESGFPNLASRGWDTDTSWLLRGAGTAVPSAPTLVKEMADAAHVALGEKHICVLRKTGQVACWGDNGHDAVGAPGFSQSLEPLVVRIP
jgi:alpha-tubulin suppressor-like RCC1 family protein